MKRDHFIRFLILMLISGTCQAYGSGGSSKACVKPKFSDFVPAENTEVAAGSGFSFTASPNTYPDSIKATVKGLPIPVKTASEKAGDITVSGTLPAQIKGTYARVDIAAEGQNRCKGSGGWLVKIAE
ncbi:hypothetical protein [Methylomicrobium sp. Wu6]|uniref:hypothetical protein n=1 Tax=Methylomicrobium sp. Wu6 TaxID=3107928 RepID=UPI002DD61A6D|nr:hypothetical protein [Methylomicrobium sp. Wu6]MEC4747316.1 hypothetical protein [Methylomicrobium sp. Wu6]